MEFLKNLPDYKLESRSEGRQWRLYLIETALIFLHFTVFFYKNFVEVDGLRLLQLFPTALRQN